MVIIFICIILLVILYFILRKDRFENQDKKKLDKQQDVFLDEIHKKSRGIFLSKDVIIDFTQPNDVLYNNIIDICGSEENLTSLFEELKKYVDTAFDKEEIQYDGIYIEKFKYSKKKYILTLFVIHNNESNKYELHLKKNKKTVTFDKLLRQNAVKPINYFLCDEGNDCTSRHTSLKPFGIPQNNFKPSVDKTSLSKTLFNIKQTPILLINRNFDYPVKIPKNIKPFPCRKNIHMWDKTSALFTQKKTKTCYGIDSGYTKRHLIPRPHPSYFSNPGFWSKKL